MPAASNNATPKATLFVCLTCGNLGRDESGAKLVNPVAQDLIATLSHTLADAPVTVQGVACLSQCTKPFAWALAAPGKEVLAFHSAITQSTAEDIATTARAYALHEYGTTRIKFAKTHFAPTLKGTLSSRIPPVSGTQ